MTHYKHDLTGDVINVDGVVATYYEGQQHWSEFDPYEGSEGSASEGGALFGLVQGLKGEKLDTALKAAGVPKKGTVAEQRDALLLKLSDGATEPVAAPEPAAPAPEQPEAPPTDDGAAETSPDKTEE